MTSPTPSDAGPRVPVHKTYKLFIGGGFPRSESGRTYRIEHDGQWLANAARASRKDVRDAVRAARGAQPGWASATAYNRGQVLYRVAEMLEGRRSQFVDELRATSDLEAAEAQAEVDAAIDRWVWYAGWSDKYHQVAGALNPVAGPYFNLSVPEPTGVVGAIAPATQALGGLVEAIAPVIVSGNTVVVVASEPSPLAAMTFAEVLATSDVPGGAVNILTGMVDELAGVLAGHLDVNAIDLTGCDGMDVTEWEQLAAENLKRVVGAPARREPTTASNEAAATGNHDSPARILAFCETKTVWHTKGW